MAADAPFGIFPGMAPFAVVHDLENLLFVKPDIINEFIPGMQYNHPPLLTEAVKPVAESCTVAFLAGKVVVGRLTEKFHGAFNLMA